jgi:H+-transporting ATPase
LGAIEEMAGMDMLCSDKTGTLTLNKMVLEPADCTFFEPGETYETVLFQAALAAKWKEPPRDALDTMVLVVLSLPPRLHPSFPPAEMRERERQRAEAQ